MPGTISTIREPRVSAEEWNPMNSTMQDAPLSIRELFRHGAEVFPDSEVITFEGERARHTSYAKVAERVNRDSTASVDAVPSRIAVA